MTYQLDLSGPWAKLNRARRHADRLRSEIQEAWKPYVEGIPLFQEYDAKDQAIVYRIKELPEISEDWALILGDAFHNLRCVGDHLAWQLAIRFHGGQEPPKNKARSVQFPVVQDETKWDDHRHTEQMVSDDRNYLKRLQPFNPRGPGERNLFLDLAIFSDFDKHRLLHIINVAAHQSTIQNVPGGYRDCQPDRRPVGDGSFTNIVVKGLRLLEPNLEVCRAFVIPLGPNPHRDLNPKLTGKVVIESPDALQMPPGYDWGPIEFLDAAGTGLATVLTRFEPSV
jgi:hypothetical protein